jgi:hypothetical protein
MTAGKYQLASRGVEDAYVTGTPKLTYFQSVYFMKEKFLISYKDNQFYSVNIAFGGSYKCKLKQYGDIIRNNFIKVILPSLFTPTNGYSYPIPSVNFIPTIYALKYENGQYTLKRTLYANDVVIYYNTVQTSWLPTDVKYNQTTNSFNFNFFDCTHIGFDTLDIALFWGFKNYIQFNKYYIFVYKTTSDLNLQNSGWIHQFSKYLRSYNDNAGTDIIDRVKLYLGGQLIEDIPGAYLSLYKDISIPQQLHHSLEILEGYVSTPSLSDVAYYVYIPLSLKNIPVSSITRQDVELDITFKTFEQLIDPKYINPYVPFGTIKTLPFVAKKIIYTGDRVFYINETNINDTILTTGDTLNPTSAIRCKSNIYVLSATSQILYIYNMVSSTISGVQYNTLSSNIKPSQSVVFIGSDVFNFSLNGIVQKLNTLTSSLVEYDIAIMNIQSVLYLNTLLYITTDTFLYILINDLTLYITYTLPERILFVIANNTNIYFISPRTLYGLSDGLYSIINLPAPNPICAYICKNNIYIFYPQNVAYVINIDITVTVTPILYALNSTSSVVCLQPSGRDDVYVIMVNSTTSGLSYYNGYNTISIGTQMYIYGIVAGSKSVWLSTTNYILIFDTNGDVYSEYQINDILSGNG